jgi:hypothetical protein
MMDERAEADSSAAADVGETRADASEIWQQSADADEGQRQGDDAGGDASTEPDVPPEEHAPEADDDDGGAAGEPEGTDARTRANRQNARRSTGPTTEEGKRRSSLNALKHGAYAQRSVAIPSGVLAEDQVEIDDYVDGIVESLNPRTAAECRVAEQFAHLMLTAERVPRYEASLIAETPDLLPLSSGAGREVANASRQALRYIEQVSKIDVRVGAALQQKLRQYEQLRKMDLAT